MRSLISSFYCTTRTKLNTSFLVVSRRVSSAGGDYDVEIPCDTVPGEYSIRVARFENPSLFSCSAPFMVVEGGAISTGSDDTSDSSDESSGDSSGDSSDDGPMSYWFSSDADHDHSSDNPDDESMSYRF